MIRRLKAEMKQIAHDQDQIAASTGGSIQILFDDDVLSPTAVLQGPKGSPYSEGIFDLDILIPSDYPFKPPKISFATKIWHPNVDFETGGIYIEPLVGEWNVCWTMQHILLAIMSILNSPILDGAVNAEAADMYTLNRVQYNNTARFWTGVHAGTTARQRQVMIRRLVQMGFPQGAAHQTLEMHDWDEDVAVETLLTMTSPVPLEEQFTSMNLNANLMTGESETEFSWTMVDTASESESCTSDDFVKVPNPSP